MNCKAILWLVLVWLISQPACAYEMATVKSDQTLMEYGGRTAWGKLKPGPVTVRSGSRVLVLFHQDGQAGVLLGPVRFWDVVSHPNYGGAVMQSVVGYLPDASLEKQPIPVEGFATLKDPDGSVKLRQSGGLDRPVVKTLPVHPEPKSITGVFVLEKGEWDKVMTSDGDIGYIHKSRVVPFVLDVGDDADKRALVSAAFRRQQARGGGSRLGVMTVEVMCGGDIYTLSPTSAKIEKHRFIADTGGRFG